MLKKLLNRLFKTNRFPTTKHDVTYAFTCGGIDYYQFTDFNSTPAMRGLKTMVFYEELKMKCTLEYLRLHVEATDNILTSSKVSIFDIKRLNDQLKQRLDIALDIEILYKIASIVFFPKNENTEDYDYAFNAKKVAHWKKHKGADFFLQKPLLELLPALKDMKGSLENYSAMVQKLNKAHLASLSQKLPEKRTAQLKGRSYSSAVVIPQK